jgi:hypothetical protein
MLSLISSENSKKTIALLLIVALGALMAARKQFAVKDLGTFEHSIMEGQERNLGHIHPLFSKNTFLPFTIRLPLSLQESTTFNVFSVVFFWALMIALVCWTFRRAGLDYYASIVLTMLVLFVAGITAREIFGIPLLGPAPNIGYQNYNWRLFVAPLSLGSILLAFRGRLTLSAVMLGLTTLVHLKYGVRIFILMFSSIVLWNLWGYRLIKKPLIKTPWRLITIFGCSWIVIFTTLFLYIKNLLSGFSEINAPRVAADFISRLGWLIKNEPDDYMISYHFNSGLSIFGFLFLAFATIILCESIRRRSPETKLKTMAVTLIFSVLIALSMFIFGFLFETFLIDHLPLNLSTMIMLAGVWNLIWVVPIAFTIAVFSCLLLWAKNLDLRFKIRNFTITKLFLHVMFIWFVILNIYIFIDKKGGSIFYKEDNLPLLNLSYTQICTEDTALYKETINRAWKFAETRNEAKFYTQLEILENIFNRTVKPAKREETNNPDVKNLKILYNLKSNRYVIASQKLFKIGAPNEGMPLYLWNCDKQRVGIQRMFLKIPFLDFYNVSQWVNKNTPIDRGVIAPPYIFGFSLYSRRVDFWDMKRDDHLMYVLKDYYPIGMHRLESLAGPYALKMAPGIRNGQIGLRGRAYFLSLKKEDLIKIKNSYPFYDYLITENSSLLGYPILYSNASFAVYDISERTN